MSQRTKNQHYLPQFYLRKFSILSEGKQIGLYNINTNFYYPNAGIKNQASKNFYYGKDGKIEKALSEIEYGYANVLSTIINEQIIPEYNTKEYISLLGLTILTKLRNPLFVENIKESQNYMNEGVYEFLPNNNEKRHQETLSALFGMIPYVTRVCADLDSKLLVNKTNIPFLISDNPIVSYNQFLEKKEIPLWKSAYGSIGIQIFFPISPNLCVLIYDPEVYIVGKNNNLKSLEIKDINEINQINMMQFLNCTSQVFFNERVSEGYVKSLHQKALKYNKANQPYHFKNDAIENGLKVGEDRYSGNTDIEVNLKISSIRIKSDVLKINYEGQKLSLKLRPNVIKLRELDRLKNQKKKQ